MSMLIYLNDPSITSRFLLVSNDFDALLIGLHELLKVGCLEGSSLQGCLDIFHHAVAAVEFDSGVNELLWILTHQVLEVSNGLVRI